MKGVVFNLFEAVVHRKYGEDVWDALLDAAGLDGSYTSLGSYPDEEMSKLVDAAAVALKLSQAGVLRWFGGEAIQILAERYPAFFAPYTSARPFVISVNKIIHPEVRKIYPGADVPVFDFHDDPDGGLMMGYHSARKLCALAEGFIEGAARYYSETLTFEHLTCMHHGDAKCLFRLSFASNKSSVDAAA